MINVHSANKMITNPFVTSGYVSPHYFCDRVEETNLLTSTLTNGNHVALISPRRLGKTGLIYHSFNQDFIKESYYAFVVDIYATKNLQEFVFELGKVVLGTLKSKGRKVWELFLNTLSSLRGSISFDIILNRPTGLVLSPSMSFSPSSIILRKMWRPSSAPVCRNAEMCVLSLPVRSGT